MRVLQYALVLVVQAALVLAVVAGIRTLAHVDPMQAHPDDRAATVPGPTPGAPPDADDSVADRFSSLGDALATR